MLCLKKMEIEQAQIAFKKNFSSDMKDIVPPVDPIESAKITSIVSSGRIWKILDVRGQSIVDK